MLPRFSSHLRVVYWCVGLLCLAGCTDPYLPDIIKTPPSYLVVDGSINPQGISSIKLSRTYAIASATAPPAETKATAYIEDDAGTRLLLVEGSSKGTYASAALTLNPARKYRLHLNTLAGKEYVSDFVPVKITPPIDALTWRAAPDGVNIYVNAHDDTKSTQYYRWETEETWEITPPYQPTHEYVKPLLIYIRTPFPRLCWGFERPSSVFISKTTALTQDVVADFRVKALASNSERLYTRYSILARQHALTKEEYAYWELLRKNTESIGTLFDPQPAQLTGNVHCVSNPAEPVLGFVGAHSTTEKRLFIARAELPNARDLLSGYEQCLPPDTVRLPPKGVFPPPKPAEVLEAMFGSPAYLPITIEQDNSGQYVLAKPRDCVDCRTRGSAVKPSFW
ncbi:DUF4249 domain-containing protein [Hymenobacter sp. BT770]|uniref:DUF4249 domain-containing protein n=1 Tax=Hymenobacter sp. BT770 TaxID=2886942 RepID=UPI001D121D6C|nr:DUF4249 domain-containing protein [Hymenobacter sp. BT770]MCC3154099.1 DUF4249 domain-containing protein [Hymenobacter sp. BT770]MDO3416243.1 DUF4249 domain-containing protein [Hymenobacter sp. BT770]